MLSPLYRHEKALGHKSFCGLGTDVVTTWAEETHPFVSGAPASWPDRNKPTSRRLEPPVADLRKISLGRSGFDSAIRDSYRHQDLSSVNRPIYLDTNLWNALLDQSIAIEPLMSDLTQHGATLAASDYTLYELSKTFAGNPTRARALCECVQRALNSGGIVVYDAMDQLHLEVESAKTGAPIVWMRAGHELVGT